MSSSQKPELSIIIPARNEELLLGETLAAAVMAARHADVSYEILLVNNMSSDRTTEIGKHFSSFGVKEVFCHITVCGAARNAGFKASQGKFLCFIDADTIVDKQAFAKLLHKLKTSEVILGLARLYSREPGIAHRLWWSLWSALRHLPLARAKSMTACMYCTREAFESYGPFSETDAIAEEWQFVGKVYSHAPEKLSLDPSITAATSSRRINGLRILTTAFKWISAVLLAGARKDYKEVRYIDQIPGRTVLSRMILGFIIDSLSINNVQPGDDHVQKKRKIWADFFILAANLFFKINQSPIVLLDSKAWPDYEQEMYHLLYQKEVIIEKEGVLLPKLPGISLERVLHASKSSMNQSTSEIISALKALSRMHQQFQKSHGDTHIRNVLVSDHDASWFDFETKHALASFTDCVIDDLLIFCLTACGYLDKASEDLLIRHLTELYADYGRAIHQSCVAFVRSPTAFRLARSKASIQQQREFAQSLAVAFATPAFLLAEEAQ